jgi:CheY-like chemotaxis protein
MVTAGPSHDDRPLVLVVDENTESTEVLQRHLVSQYEILGAGDGLEGYALAVAHKPAAIVIDIVMPIVDGWTVMRKIRSNPATRHTPILIATALERQSVMPEATRLGVQGVLRKPLVLSELTRELDRFTSPR